MSQFNMFLQTDIKSFQTNNPPIESKAQNAVPVSIPVSLNELKHLQTHIPRIANSYKNTRIKYKANVTTSWQAPWIIMIEGEDSKEVEKEIRMQISFAKEPNTHSLFSSFDNTNNNDTTNNNLGFGFSSFDNTNANGGGLSSLFSHISNSHEWVVNSKLKDDARTEFSKFEHYKGMVSCGDVELATCGKDCDFNKRQAIKSLLSLSDIDNNNPNFLGFDEFCLFCHLLQMLNQHKEIPRTLSPEYIPPSLRNSKAKVPISLDPSSVSVPFSNMKMNKVNMDGKNMFEETLKLPNRMKTLFGIKELDPLRRKHRLDHLEIRNPSKNTKHYTFVIVGNKKENVMQCKHELEEKIGKLLSVQAAPVIEAPMFGLSNNVQGWNATGMDEKKDSNNNRSNNDDLTKNCQNMVGLINQKHKDAGFAYRSLRQMVGLFKHNPKKRPIRTIYKFDNKLAQSYLGIPGVEAFLRKFGFEADQFGLRLHCDDDPSEDVLNALVKLLDAKVQNTRDTSDDSFYKYLQDTPKPTTTLAARIDELKDNLYTIARDDDKPVEVLNHIVDKLSKVDNNNDATLYFGDGNSDMEKHVQQLLSNTGFRSQNRDGTLFKYDETPFHSTFRHNAIETIKNYVNMLVNIKNEKEKEKEKEKQNEKENYDPDTDMTIN